MAKWGWVWRLPALDNDPIPGFAPGLDLRHLRNPWVSHEKDHKP